MKVKRKLDISPARRTWRTEFGNDWKVPSGFILQAGFKDQSWHNDASPSFALGLSPVAARAVLWCDHPDAARRELPDSRRFTVTVDGVGSDVETILCTDDVGEAIKAAQRAFYERVFPSAAQIASRFAKLLKAALTPEQLAEVIRRNDLEPDPTICASHDFLDANLVMARAVFELTGCHMASARWLNDEVACARWGQAWAIAKAARFTNSEAVP